MWDRENQQWQEIAVEVHIILAPVHTTCDKK